MTQIQIDPALQQQLNGTTNPVALCDASGRILGHFLPEPEYMRMLYASFKSPLSDEELARRESEPGEYTLDEIWKLLGRT
jgi:hypothetical protein